MAYSVVAQGGFRLDGASGTKVVTFSTVTGVAPLANDVVIITTAADEALPYPQVLTSGYDEPAPGFSQNTVAPGRGRSCYYKRMGATPDTTVSLDYLEGSRTVAGIISIVRGLDTTTLSAGTATSDDKSSGMPDPASMTTAYAPAVRIITGYLDDDDAAAGITAPSGFSDLFAYDTGQGSVNTIGATAMIAFAPAPTTGPLDPGAFSGGSGDDAWFAFHFALREAAPAGPARYTAELASSADSGSYTFTGTPIGDAASDRIVVVACTHFGGAAPTSVTIGGVSAGLLVKSAEVANAHVTSLWSAAVPSGTTATIAVTLAASQSWFIGAVWSVTGCAATPIATAADNDTGFPSAGDTLDISLAAENEGAIVAFVGGSNVGGFDPTYSGMLIAEAPVDVGGGDFGRGRAATHNPTATEATRSISASYGGVGDYYSLSAAAVSFGPVGGGGTIYNANISLDAATSMSHGAALNATAAAAVPVSAGMAPAAAMDAVAAAVFGASAGIAAAPAVAMSRAMALALGAGIDEAAALIADAGVALEAGVASGATATVDMAAAMALATAMAQEPGASAEADAAASFGAVFGITADGDLDGDLTGTVALAATAGLAMSAQLQAGAAMALGAAVVVSPAGALTMAGAMALSASVAASHSGGLLVTGEILLPAAVGQEASATPAYAASLTFAAELDSEQAAGLDATAAIDLATAAALAVAGTSSGDVEIITRVALTGERRNRATLTGTMNIRVALTGIIKQ